MMLKHLGEDLMNILGLSSKKKDRKKYYIISADTDLKLIGCYPRILTFLGEDKRDFFTTGERQQYTSVTTKNFSYIELYKRAKLTDFFWADVGNMQGVFFNKKVLDILKDYKIGHYECTDVTFVKRNKKGDKLIDDYQWIMFDPNNHQLIDFEQSKFIIEDFITKKNIGDIQISSFNNLSEERNKLKELGESKFIRIKEVMLSDYTNNLEMFSHRELNDKFRLVISETLLLALQKKGITGFEVRPAIHWKFI